MGGIRGEYSTRNEIAYLNGLGLNEWVIRSQSSRSELLIKYLKTCELRQVWGAIDKDAVKKHVLALLHSIK